MFFLVFPAPPRATLFPYTTLFRSRTAGRAVRLLIGPWGHGRGLYTRVGMRDALAALDAALADGTPPSGVRVLDRKSTRLNSSHGYISYAVFCLKQKMLPGRERLLP